MVCILETDCLAMPDMEVIGDHCTVGCDEKNFYSVEEGCINCADNCKECVGPSETECRECYDYATLESNSECVCQAASTRQLGAPIFGCEVLSTIDIDVPTMSPFCEDLTLNAIVR